MILKHIRCFPRAGAYDQCLAVQAAWDSETCRRNPVATYVTCLRQPEEYVVLAFWPDPAALETFTAVTHEDLMCDHAFGPLLASYRVTHWALLGPVARLPDSAAIREGRSVVRHTECVLKSGREGEFFESQARTWSPGMGGTTGFLGGWIAQQREDPARVLVVTFFESADAHARYRTDVLPGLRLRGRASLDALVGLEGHELVVHRWFAR